MPTSWKNDSGLFELCRRELFTAVIGDVLDKIGFQHQFLPPSIRALRDDMVAVGRAMTVLEADCFTEAHTGQNPLMAKPFGLMLEALDDLKTGEVYVCAGASPRYALWGELMSIRAQKLGAVGAVMDGYSRDTPGILELDFPCFSHGPYAQDQGPRGKVIDFRCPLEIAGVHVQPGDLVFGDVDGVLVIPQEAEVEAIEKALEKARGEKTVRKAIEAGMPAAEAFEKFGIM